MVRNSLFIFIFISLFAFSCDDCVNCEPFTEEPYLKVLFINSSDSTEKVISIDSVNQFDAKEFRHFSDTTNVFRFPLDMQRDTSSFNLVYHKIDSVVAYQNNTLSIYYDREYVRRGDNYVVVECDINGLDFDFNKAILKCRDSSTVECISNEAFLKVYN